MNHWQPPREFDGFVLVAPIGQGGMGRVYLAHEVALDRPVALKFIAQDHPGASARERFLVEARAVARIQHPNVVAIYRIGAVAEHPYIAYEYVDGESLDRVEKPVPWTRALEVGLAVARALAAAHQRGVLHRDIKPANVIRARDGAIKLVDFGVAKFLLGATSAPPTVEEAPTPSATAEDSWESIGTADTAQASGLVARAPRIAATPDGAPATATGALVGTPRYLPPEVWRGEHASARSDVYAVGLLLYELTVGGLPFSGLSGVALMRRVTEHALPPLAHACPDVPASFARVVDRAVARAPADRFADGAELLAAVEAVDGVLRGFRLIGGADGPHDDVARVTASLLRVQERAEALFASVYHRLFARRPELAPLFPPSMVAQHMKLAAALRLTVENLRDPTTLVPVLEELGRRHRGYGVRPEYFPAFEEALLGAIHEFDHAWDAATERAWKRAYAAVTEALLRGLQEAPHRASA